MPAICVRTSVAHRWWRDVPRSITAAAVASLGAPDPYAMPKVGSTSDGFESSHFMRNSRQGSQIEGFSSSMH